MRKILLCVWSLGLLLVLAGCGGKTVDPFDYVSVEFSGLDGRGQAKTVVDSALEEAVLSAAGYKGQDNADVLAYLDLYASFDYELDIDEGLSNGDTVTVSIRKNDAILEKHKLKLSPLSKEFTVEGLREGVPVDLFADLEIVWEGASPFLSVKAVSRSSDSFLKSVRYSIQDNTNRRIGDEVLVEATVNQSQAEENGYLIEETQKAFVISAADKNIESFDEISQEFLEKLLSEVNDKVVGEFANRGGSLAYSTTRNMSYTLSSGQNRYGPPVLRDILLLTPKPNTALYGSGTFSCLYITALVHVTGKGDLSAEVPVLVVIPEVVLRENGEVTARFENMSVSHQSGVMDADVLVQNTVDKFKADYTSERGVLNYTAPGE